MRTISNKEMTEILKRSKGNRTKTKSKYAVYKMPRNTITIKKEGNK
jgi:hypothetical protein